MDNTAGSLTKLERSIIIGSILGDGYMRIMPGRSDAFLEINHSVKAKDYVDYKFNKLKRICESVPKERATNEDRHAYRFFTKQHKDLTTLYGLFYKNKRKIIPKNLELDPMSIAIWYMDDGSKSRDSDVYLNTQQFSLLDQKKLLNCLRKFGINARLNKDKKYYRIRILKESIQNFMDIVAPYMAPSMKYKLVMTL
ncbi:MAG: hypothetical protein A2Z62_01165 [Candidatus Terrybacteria bacterium RIFCSPLOWO2_02_42_20]|uniref:Homing endonuclease LAGLIDADG domain-containing protein n=1 Tax=Candidatus Terrybacteria bacterium RIFCSPLOWO2_02_42_20 TaxID=1802370 RepID=A0A1G2PY66_9BACT|nr:MAG: hypothetical protein A2Z62_01165 [Candidatus Terrybacteria bacterium RIFCSPLOWO2_02_42_20]